MEGSFWPLRLGDGISFGPPKRLILISVLERSSSRSPRSFDFECRLCISENDKMSQITRVCELEWEVLDWHRFPPDFTPASPFV